MLAGSLTIRPSLPRVRAASKCRSSAPSSSADTSRETPKPGVASRPEAVESLSTRREWQPKQGLHAAVGAEGHGVERDEDAGHFGQQCGWRLLATEPSLESLEWHRAAVLPGQQLAVEDPLPGQICGSRYHLGELAADVVKVAAVEADLAIQAMELGSDAVVLVLDPDRAAQPCDDFGSVSGRRREHRLERPEERQGRGIQGAVAGQLSGSTDVARQHTRPT